MRTKYLVFGTVFLTFSLLVGGLAYAQVGSQEVENRRAQLEAELADLEKQIEEQRAILQEKQREKVSLERDVAIIDAEIEEAELSIRARNIAIRKLGGEIGGKEEAIDSLSAKMDREKESLAQLIRKTNEIDSFSLAEMILSGQNLSDFFVDVDSFGAVKAGLQDSFVTIEHTKRLTTAQKNLLEEKQREEISLRQLQELQKTRIEEKRAERNSILDITKGEERVYQEVLAATQKTAAEIRAELFNLRGTDAIPFGEALDLANKASAKTGVRPAFILGIFRQESNLGENVGNCNLPEDPPQYKWQSIMKSPRDTVPYRVITESLGLSPDSMPLSCAPSYGYGGAMGPAQFIPSTWALFTGYEKVSDYEYKPYNSAKDKIGRLSGNQPPNPWDPEDAFMASAFLLKENGATRSRSTCELTNDPEECAALRYFAGWGGADNPSYRFYGRDVMNFAEEYQQNIDILQGN